MNTRISEFIDTYSDDIIYLQEARKVLLTHPLRREIKFLCDASFCRMLTIMMIGSIENMLQEWKNKDKLGILEKYFAKRASNSERVKSLYEAFQLAGVNVDWEVFADYLAIKYLRNVIVHTQWKRDQKEWLEKRGFPTDTRKLTEDHWWKINSVNENMMFYISITELLNPSKKPPAELVKLRETPRRQDDLGLVRKDDIPQIFWHNLEKISERLQREIEQTVLTEGYNWAKGLSPDELRELSQWQLKRLFYMAARRAGKDGFHHLSQYRGLAKEALDNWREYWRLTFEQSRISLEKIKKGVEVLDVLHQKGIYPKELYILLNLPTEAAIKIIPKILKGYQPLRKEEIVFALNIGKTVYEILPNITPVLLFLVQLPIVDPDDTESYLQEGEKALLLMEARDYWYSYVELKAAPEVLKWAFYKEICDEFRKDSKRGPH